MLLSVVVVLLLCMIGYLGFADFCATIKAVLDPIANIEHCTIVYCMARNGYEFGIRVSGMGDEWFNAPAPFPEGLLREKRNVQERMICV